MQDNENKVIDLHEVREGENVKYVPIDGEEAEDVAFCRKGRGKWWLLIFVFAVLAMTVLLSVTSKEVVDESEITVAEVVKTEDQIYEATYVERNLEFSGCGHKETQLLHGDSRFVGKTFSQLQAEGWEVSKIGSNKVRVYMETDGLCENDSQKRTLKLTENGVGVFEGPKDADGQLLNEMVLDIDTLPADLRSQLDAGGIEFTSEDELLEMLDSLDEYVSYEYEDYYRGLV